MKKLLFILLLLPFAVFGQTTYQLNYDSIRVNKTDGTGGTSLYGDVWLKNTGLGSNTDSVLTEVGGKIKKIPRSDFQFTNALPAPGVVTKAEGGAGVLSAGTYSIGVTAVSANGGESSFDFDGYYYTSDQLTIGASKSIDVSWGAVDGAVAYRVYIGDNTGSYYLRYFETTNLSLNINTVPPAAITVPVLTPSNTGGSLKAGNYYVAYTAVFADGETVGPTSQYLFPVANITSDVGSIGVTWTAVTGATGYKVYVISETDGSFRMATKYFTTATNSATITGSETYVTGLGALSSKGNIEFESTAPVIGGSFVQTGNNKSFFSADIAINGFKGANADLLLKRYDNALTPFGFYSFAGLSLGTGTATNWQSGVGTADNDWNTYNYGTAGLSTKLSYTDNTYSVYGQLKALSGVKATGLGTLTEAGSEMVYTAGTGFFQTYDRAGANYLPTVLTGSTLDLRIGASSALSIDASRNVSLTNGISLGANKDISIGAGRLATWNTAGTLSIGDLDNDFTDLNIYHKGVIGLKFSGGQVAELSSLAGTGDRMVQASSTGVLSASQIVTSGTYTPTLTNGTNVDSSTSSVCQYTRIGNIVTVFGKIDVDATTLNSQTDVDISLPIASNFAAVTDLNGMTTTMGTNSGYGFVKASIADDRGTLSYFAASTSTTSQYFSFSYQVL
jgi:hypothetical protein